MGQFLYLVPEQGGAATLIKKYGLERRLSDSAPSRGCSLGLAGGKLHKTGEGCESEFDGLCMSLGEPLGVYLDDQVWEKVEEPGALAFWLGYAREQKPGPIDLARQETVPGHWVTLGDGDEWIVPVARSFREDRVTLPHNMRMGPDGKIVKSLKQEYRDLFDRASPIADEIYNSGATTINDEVLFKLAVDGLSVNYRVGIAEVNLLGLLDTQTCLEVLKAMIDLPALEWLMKLYEPEQKKKSGGDEPTSELEAVDGGGDA